MKTQNLNSKANVKQYTGADLPFQPKQPVIAKGNIDSTLNQTVVNLPFTVDTINAQDSFFLIIDGKVLTIGASNDYTMTSIDSIGFSSQATLTTALPAGLNIQYYKLGLKKESEFAQDSRFVNVYDSLDKGFQGFIATNQLLVATTNSGTPATGTFHSTVVNRKSLVDLTQDLKPRMGIDRIMTQSVVEIQDEFGPSGERVFRVINDTSDGIRLIGNWSSVVGTAGQYAANSSTSGSYIEVTFYGTGLNLLVNAYGVSQSYLISIDGNTETSLTTPTYSSILDNRNYSTNQHLSVASSLTLGVHTVRVKTNSASFNMALTGLEIINTSTNIITNPGVGYIQGKKAVASISSVNYATGVTGNRGGRIVTYLNQDGSIGRAFRAVGSQANLSSADHSNEEMIRSYHFREFGTSRTDDFSSLVSTSSNRAFTLEDGTTTLAGVGVYAPSEALSAFDNSSIIIFTFVGTGLDIINNAGGGATLGAIIVDGTNIGNYVRTANANSLIKVVSGLPYGTHTVKFTHTAGGASLFNRLLIYGPKKPTIPSGAIELSDYNVMADYSSATQGLDNVSVGVLRKQATRENIYSGTWALTLAPSASIGAWRANSSTSGAFAQYTFFGTGFDLRAIADVTYTANATVTINGLTATTTNFPSLTSSVTSGFTFNNTTGAFTQNVNATGARLTINSLPLGIYTVRITANTTAALSIEAFDIITPIHSAKSNGSYVQQNSLAIGSVGISDNRLFTPVKDSKVKSRNISQAIAVGTSSVSSTVALPMPDMSVAHNCKTGKIKITFTGSFTGPTAAGTIQVQPFVNGVSVGVRSLYATPSTGLAFTITSQAVVDVPIGVSKIDMTWFSDSGATYSSMPLARNVIVEDVDV